MNKEIPRLQGETDAQYEKRCKAIHYLGTKWVLNGSVPKQAVPVWRC